MGLPERWQFRPHFNFITIHCACFISFFLLNPMMKSRRDRVRPMLITVVSTDAYVIGMAIIASVIIYPCKNMRYIDALFFAAGGATQSGLNT